MTIGTSRIGFIGLGLMGSAMVERLQTRGYSITVMANRSRTNVDAAVKRGAVEAKTPEELTKASDIVMLCMDTSQNVESRIYGKDGVLAGVTEGTIVIDFGTSLPDSSKKIGADMAKKGASFLDAPLGRTPAHATNGALNIMCGGSRAAFDKVKPILDDLGENVFYVGPLGTGHTIKLINNFFAMTTACAMSEAFALGDAAEVPREQLYQVMAAGPLRSGMMDFIRSYALEQKIDLAFTIANASKDVAYYRKMAEDLGVSSRMSGAAAETLSEALREEWGDRMVPEMVDFLANRPSGTSC